MKCMRLVTIIMGLLCVVTLASVKSESSPMPDYPDRIEYLKRYYESFRILSHTVKPGDTLWAIFERLNILKENTDCIQKIDHMCSIKPGDHFSILVDAETGRVSQLRYENKMGEYLIKKNNDEWTYYPIEHPILKLREIVSGVIEDNVYNAAVQRGVSPSVVVDLSDIFASDVDFTTDLRKGDVFVMLLEKYYMQNGSEYCPPKILAARIVVKGEEYEAYYFDTPKKKGGYYDREGNSKERFFLKAPLQYRRISSYFTARRFHPILKIYRPHYGIDYAAPEGTPVSALGDGVVTFAGRKGGYGKFVEITHNSMYKTTYGHLSRFAHGLRTGKRVKRGEIIGYVGSTGLATGPHLDFRFYVRRKPVNFLKTKWPHVTSIPKSLKPKFIEVRSKYAIMLDKECEKVIALSSQQF